MRLLPTLLAIFLGLLALITIFWGVPLTSQTAKVIALSPEDAKARAALEAQRVEIENKIEALDEAIRMRYTTVGEKDPEASSVQSLVGLSSLFDNGPSRYYRRGWEHGVNYTEDFKFIVPLTFGYDYSYTAPGCLVAPVSHFTGTIQSK